VGASLDEAARWLTEYIEDVRREVGQPPAEREGLDTWVDKWREDCGAKPAAARVLVDAMARFTLQLKSTGAPPRKMSGVYSDLDAAGMLVFMYDAPRGKKVLKHFAHPPWAFEFKPSSPTPPGWWPATSETSRPSRSSSDAPR